MKLAIFPGTFNPIHIAHLIMAENAREQAGADKIIFITAKIPPHRNKEIAPAEHRHRMVELSCQNNKHFEASNLELLREGPSYSYETIRQAKELFNIKDRIPFIIGSDAISQLATWFHAQELVDCTHFLIVKRPGSAEISAALNATSLVNYSYNIINSPLLEISSTLIRDNISRGTSIKYLVEEQVEEYILNNKLYRRDEL